MTESEGAIRIRPPNVDDGAPIHRLVVQSSILDVNSCYAYLLLCRDFAATCRVADADGELAGFVTGYCPPERRDTLFIWQIAVDSRFRRRGLARRMMQDLLESEACRGITALETTVSPSNAASRALFERLASRLGAQLEESEGFPAALFGGGEHESEPLLRVAPLRLGDAGNSASA